MAPPVFSVPHGFMSSPFSLALSTPTSGATIRYTTNGATPSPSSGSVYSSPISITTTTPVRAIAFTSSTAKSVVVSETYIFLAAVRNQPNNPSGYPTTFAATDDDGPYPADYEMDPEVVNNAAYTNKIEGALTAIPTVSITTDIANLFSPSTGIYYNPNEKGSDWERPISIEYIDPEGGPGFTESAGLRIHGQASRRPFRTPKHSFRVYFKASYGTAKLDFKLFEPEGELFDPAAKFDRLILRNGGNRSWPYFDRDQRRETDYVNDEWAREAHLAMGHLSPHGTYVHLYLNGLYWGLYNLAERPDEKFIGRTSVATPTPTSTTSSPTRTSTTRRRPTPARSTRTTRCCRCSAAARPSATASTRPCRPRSTWSTWPTTSSSRTTSARPTGPITTGTCSAVGAVPTPASTS